MRADGGQRKVLVICEEERLLKSVTKTLRSQANTEFMAIDSCDEALKLLRKNRVNWVILEMRTQDTAALELLVEGSDQDPPVHFILIPPRKSDGVSYPERASLFWYEKRPVEPARIEQIFAAGESKNGQDGTADPAGPPLAPADLLIAAQQSRDEAWIRVTDRSGEQGDFCVRAGRAVYAESGKLTGEKAAHQILTWTDCGFEFRELPGFLQDNMDRPLRDLLAETRGLMEPDAPDFMEASGEVAEAEAAEASAAPAAQEEVEEPSDLAEFDEPETPVLVEAAESQPDIEEPPPEPDEMDMMPAEVSAEPAEAEPPMAEPAAPEPPIFEAPMFEPAIFESAELEPEPPEFEPPAEVPAMAASAAETVVAFPETFAAAPELTPTQQAQVDQAFTSLADQNTTVWGVGLLSVRARALISAFYRDGAPPFDCPVLADAFRHSRSIVDRQRLGIGRHMVVAGMESSLVLTPLADDIVLVVQLAGAYPFWPAENLVTDCELAIRASLELE